MQTLWQDLRYGARMLAKQPGFTLIAVVILALGIGANATIFSVLDALWLKPLPGVTEPSQLVQVGQTYGGKGFNSVSFPDYRDYAAQTTAFAAIAAESEQQFHFGTDKAAERIKGSLVTGNYFDVLGVQPKLGRLLQPAESVVEGANPVAVISERLWRHQFGASPNVAGTAVSLNSHSYTIVGVAAEFKGTSRMDENTDVWIPITMWRHGNPWMVQIGADWLNSRSSDFAGVIGRLKPGVTVAQAQADLDVIAARLGLAYPKTNAKRGARVVAGLGMSPGDSAEIGQLVTIQFGIVALVLLIACANIAGLTLARTAARQKEIGVRLALGAGRWRVVRQLLTESTLLALLGGMLSLMVAWWLTDALRIGLPDEQSDMRASLGFALNRRVFGFTAGISVLTGLLFGLAPALQATRTNLLPLLKNSGSAVSRHTRTRLRSGLVVAQIALSLMLLVSAGLCVRSLQKAQAINVGFSRENVLTARLDLGRQNYSEQQGKLFYQQLLERLGGLPGVESASLALTVPLQGNSFGNNAATEMHPNFNVKYNVVTPDYPNTIGLPLLVGRGFTEQDKAEAPRVALINETFARRIWPNENPLGKVFRWKNRKGDEPVEVVGVVRDAKGHSLFDEPSVTAYFPFAQQYNSGMTLHLRAAAGPESLLAAVQQQIRSLDARLPIYQVKTLDAYWRDALFTRRLQTFLIGGFGLLALVLAALGLYGVLAFSVAQRTREIGIRMALGAQGRDVLRLVVGQGIKLVALGAALGLAGAFAATRVLKSLLYGISPTDPPTFISVPLVLLTVALLACWIPARRATKVEPMIALRCE
ncbi:MAG TPA: ABC transporter permease [Blastocatellia bacterium]|nr:ABC transporter permease [Blastocatellia bacterium]HMX29283.1 ABC transporter permease [Blastocatellia bacterium]